MIARRNIPSAIAAPTTAPSTETIPLVIVPEKSRKAGAAGIKESNPVPPHRNITKTSNPMMINIAPTARLLPDPKYAVNIPAMMLAMEKTSVNMLKKWANILLSPP